ncbi:hypothetical protein [Chryseobacterium indoltheticum]|jgi:hypothetical protein|uniref:hypothetical protein n=1 Tax=Chryseobacterium indoltheticum TaxID=254 RepID=UPI003C6CB00E
MLIPKSFRRLYKKLPSIYTNPRELLEKAGLLFRNARLLFKIAYLAFSNLTTASISLRSIPGRKAIFALLIIEELNLSAVSAPSLLNVKLKDPKSPNLTILPSERC